MPLLKVPVKNIGY